jgi:hypothetical protein
VSQETAFAAVPEKVTAKMASIKNFGLIPKTPTGERLKYLSMRGDASSLPFGGLFSEDLFAQFSPIGHRTDCRERPKRLSLGILAVAVPAALVLSWSKKHQDRRLS